MASPNWPPICDACPNPDIRNAIAAHETWGVGLSEALAKQELSPALERAGYDDMCQFGRWLYCLEDRAKITQLFRRVKDLHYRFHQEAAGVVEMAGAGDFDSARLLSNSAPSSGRRQT